MDMYKLLYHVYVYMFKKGMGLIEVGLSLFPFKGWRLSVGIRDNNNS